MEACISLGGNIGEVATTFRQALRQLDDAPGATLIKASGLYESAPVGANAGKPFLNAAAILDTSLSPHELLALLQQIEDSHNRTRETHWGPRTLDLDLILFGQETIDTPELTVPHPHSWYRRFVVEPLAEIAPNVLHPSVELQFAQLQKWLASDNFRMSVHGPCELLDSSPEFLASLSTDFPGVTMNRSSGTVLEDVREVTVSFSDNLDPLPPFWLRGNPEQPEQFLRDLLNATRGEVSRVSRLD